MKSLFPVDCVSDKTFPTYHQMQLVLLTCVNRMCLFDRMQLKQRRHISRTAMSSLKKSASHKSTWKCFVNAVFAARFVLSCLLGWKVIQCARSGFDRKTVLHRKSMQFRPINQSHAGLFCKFVHLSSSNRNKTWMLMPRYSASGLNRTNTVLLDISHGWKANGLCVFELDTNDSVVLKCLLLSFQYSILLISNKVLFSSIIPQHNSLHVFILLSDIFWRFILARGFIVIV